MARAKDILKSPFAFLFQRPQKEELVAEYVIREHRSGRALNDILEDAYVTNRLNQDEIGRVLDRPEVVHSLGEDVVRSEL